MSDYSATILELALVGGDNPTIETTDGRMLRRECPNKKDIGYRYNFNLSKVHVWRDLLLNKYHLWETWGIKKALLYIIKDTLRPQKPRRSWWRREGSDE